VSQQGRRVAVDDSGSSTHDREASTVTAGALVLARDVVRVDGPDAVSYLQGQLSQDIDALAVGGSAFSLVLQPQGKVDAFLRVTRTADDEVVLDVDAGWGEAVMARLRRFKLRVAAELSIVEWPVVAVRGIGPPDVGSAPDVWTVEPETPGAIGYDLVGPGARVPDGIEPLDVDRYEELRIRAGVPRMGSELDESTIPATAGIVERTVSFTKGCYTGQELVARIDSRGDRVPNRLRGLRLDAPVPPGATLHQGERAIGRVTSSVSSVALAYVRREVETPAEATARWDAGEVGVRIEPLPLT
jgi:tRNA-modifying protein YgfZ